MGGGPHISSSNVTATTNIAWDCNDAAPARFPEQARKPTPPTNMTGICFSGGGTRALCAAMGQLRALQALGVLETIDYIGAVSGGAWASSAYVYNQLADDATLFGPHTEPGAITVDGLKNASIDPHCLAVGATYSFGKAMLAEMASGTPLPKVWINAVGNVFFKPLGLFDSKNRSYFTMDAASHADIIARNPALAQYSFRLLRADHAVPYLIVTSTTMGPKQYAPFAEFDPVPFEYTPLYVGAATNATINVTHNAIVKKTKYVVNIGGALVESFAADSLAAFKKGETSQTVPLASMPFDIVDAVGTSSSAPAGVSEYLPGVNGFSPAANYAVDYTSDENMAFATLAVTSPLLGRGSVTAAAAATVHVATTSSDTAAATTATTTATATATAVSTMAAASSLGGATGSAPTTTVSTAAVTTTTVAATATAATAAGPAKPLGAEQASDIDVMDDIDKDWVAIGCPPAVTPDEYLLDFCDGGCMENYGLLPLLRRKVQRIVVFINSASQLQATPFDVTQPWLKQGVDPYLPPLFGYPVDMTEDGVNANHNQVFEQSALLPVLESLQSQKAAGFTAATRVGLTVQANERWGIVGGWTVQIMFVHLDRIGKWEQALTPDALTAVFTAGIGSKRFPNYRTIDEDPTHYIMPDIMTLYASQIQLLANLTHYAVVSGCSNPTYIADFLRK